jgi:hypothetical protein
MARGIRLTKAERDVLRTLLEAPNAARGVPRHAKAVTSILEKLSASEESPKGVDVAPIEEALIAAARGKVIALEAGHARASVQAKAVGATPETAAMVGAWMARQGWLQGPMTVLDVFQKWYQWVPKARATAPPAELKAGLGEDKGVREGAKSPSTAGDARSGAFVGRTVPGFR